MKEIGQLGRDNKFRRLLRGRPRRFWVFFGAGIVASIIAFPAALLATYSDSRIVKLIVIVVVLLLILTAFVAMVAYFYWQITNFRSNNTDNDR